MGHGLHRWRAPDDQLEGSPVRLLADATVLNQRVIDVPQNQRLAHATLRPDFHEHQPPTKRERLDPRQ
jgi:hypothetical protein